MVKIAREVASEPDLQMRMQGIVLLGAFLRLTPYARDANMSDDQVYAGVEKALRKYFGKRGDRVVQDYGDMKEVPTGVMHGDLFDLQEAERTVAAKNPGYTFEEVKAHLASLEKKQ